MCTACDCLSVDLQWTPLWWRIFLTALVQHVGGVHSGCAASGVAWLAYSVVRAFQRHARQHTPAVVLAWAVVTLAVAVVVMVAAMPSIRHYHHKYVFLWHWELTPTNSSSLLLSASSNATTVLQGGRPSHLLGYLFACQTASTLMAASPALDASW